MFILTRLDCSKSILTYSLCQVIVVSLVLVSRSYWGGLANHGISRDHPTHFLRNQLLHRILVVWCVAAHVLQKFLSFRQPVPWFLKIKANGESLTSNPANQTTNPWEAEFHECCWETLYMFADCGLVVAVQPLNCYCFAPLSTSTKSLVLAF